MDFAVFGSTPLARLLAGLLCQTHGRRTVLIGESHARYRLPRGIDLSLAAVTRPQSWAIFTTLVPETTRILGKIAGRQGWGHTDPVFFAETPAAREALGHVQHMAAGFGVASEAVPASLLGPNRDGIRLLDTVLLHRPVIEPALDRWLDDSGVSLIMPDRVEIADDGGTLILAGDQTFVAKQAILADDAAIMAYLPLRQWPTLLARRLMSSVLTTPMQPLSARIMAHVDTGTWLMQQDGGAIAATGPGSVGAAATRLAGLLNTPRPVEQAGQVSFKTLVTQDGAPAFGRAAGIGADIVVGLGAQGAFLAPALARWLTGAATPQEAAWFGERLVGRGDTPASVADYQPDCGAIA